jgi:plastocyanin
MTRGFIALAVVLCTTLAVRASTGSGMMPGSLITPINARWSDDDDDDRSGRRGGEDSDDHRGRGRDGEDDHEEAATAPEQPAQPGVVQIVDRAFLPQTITIKAGEAVTWTNLDGDEHTATGRGFDTGTIQPGQSATVVFTAPGIYDYVCQFHGEMTGQVVVTGADGHLPATATQTPAPATSGAAGAAVAIADFAFEPVIVTVPAGSAVTWTNTGVAPHTVTGAFGDSGTLASGQTFTHTFTEAGTFDYACQFHPQMTGQVVVEGAATAAGPEQGSGSLTGRDALGQVRLLLTLLIAILLLLRDLLP